MSKVLKRVAAGVRNRLPSRHKVRDPRPRRTYYDGSERPDTCPPGRYARGKHAVPAPPGGSVW